MFARPASARAIVASSAVAIAIVVARPGAARIDQAAIFLFIAGTYTPFLAALGVTELLRLAMHLFESLARWLQAGVAIDATSAPPSSSSPKRRANVCAAFGERSGGCDAVMPDTRASDVPQDREIGIGWLNIYFTRG